MRSSKQRNKGEFKNLPRIKPDSELEGDEETARREHSYTCPPNINIRGEDGKESNTKQADKSGGAADHAEQLTFDGAARSSMAGEGRLQAHKIESM
jgi:hypothetical protein